MASAPSPPCPPQVGKELVVDNGSVMRNPNSSSHSEDYDYWNYNMACVDPVLLSFKKESV